MLHLWKRLAKKKGESTQPPTIGELQAKSASEKLGRSLDDNLRRLQELFGHSSDLIVRRFRLGDNPKIAAALIQIDGVVDATFTARDLMGALMKSGEESAERHPDRITLEDLRERALTVANVQSVQVFSEIGTALPMGETLLLIEGESYGLLCSTQGFQRRGIMEPESESGVRVPRDGFTEVLSVNRSLIRRRIRDPRLHFEQITLGAVTQTTVEIAYIYGIVDEALVDEVRQRLEKIKIDGIFESGYLEAYIADNPYSIFPTMRRTERPDTVASGLLEGRVAILTDGTPFVLVVPCTLPEMLHASEDYYVHWSLSTFVRLFRYVSFAVAMVAPAIYIALITFHQEMIPSSLLHSVAASREGVPFPAAVEALAMLAVFEVLREAGIRLPRIVGSVASSMMV